MKKVSNLLAALVFASLVIFMSCGGGGDDPAPSIGETTANNLLGTWNVSGAPTYGGDVEGDWTGFTLTISNVAEGADDVWGGDFSVSNIPDGYGQVWGGNATATSVSGSWTFSSATNVTTATRSDGVSITSIQVSETDLGFGFNVPSSGAARTSGIFDANWSFQFTK